MAIDTLHLAVFISGRGSNMQALIDSCQSSDFPARISVVLSNRPDAAGLEKAEQAGIPTVVVDHKSYLDKKSFESALLEEVQGYDVDVICLAGFMRLLTSHFIDGWGKPILNIHPSLLPDYKGVNTHERVLADGKSETGCTVHHVIPAMDSGEIIVQKRVPVLDGDTPETLATRVLEQEHIAYPEAVRQLAATLKKS